MNNTPLHRSASPARNLLKALALITAIAALGGAFAHADFFKELEKALDKMTRVLAAAEKAVEQAGKVLKVAKDIKGQLIDGDANRVSLQESAPPVGSFPKAVTSVCYLANNTTETINAVIRIARPDGSVYWTTNQLPPGKAGCIGLRNVLVDDEVATYRYGIAETSVVMK